MGAEEPLQPVAPVRKPPVPIRGRRGLPEFLAEGELGADRLDGQVVLGRQRRQGGEEVLGAARFPRRAPAGSTLRSFLAYGGFTGGISMATGDTDGYGRAGTPRAATSSGVRARS